MFLMQKTYHTYTHRHNILIMYMCLKCETKARISTWCGNMTLEAYEMKSAQQTELVRYVKWNFMPSHKNPRANVSRDVAPIKQDIAANEASLERQRCNHFTFDLYWCDMTLKIEMKCYQKLVSFYCVVWLKSHWRRIYSYVIMILLNSFIPPQIEINPKGLINTIAGWMKDVLHPSSG